MPTSSVHTDQIIVSLKPDNSVRGINVYSVATFYGEDGQPTGAAPIPPRDATLDDVAGLLAPALVTQQGQIVDLTGQLASAKADAQAAATKAAGDLATAQAATKAAQDAVAAKQATLEALQARLDALTAPATEPDLLAQLNGAFEAAIPPEARPAFAEKYAIVRILVQAGQTDMARHVIEQTSVPPELEPAKAQLLAFFASAA